MTLWKNQVFFLRLCLRENGLIQQPIRQSPSGMIYYNYKNLLLPEMIKLLPLPWLETTDAIPRALLAKGHKL